MTTEIWDEAFIDETNIDESDIEGSDDLTIQGSDNDDTSKKYPHIKMSNKKCILKIRKKFSSWMAKHI